MERLFKQLEHQENGNLYFKKGTHYNSQDFTHISKGELIIPFDGGRHELCFQSLKRDQSEGYKHHLHSYVNPCKHSSLFIIAPRKTLNRIVKPRAYYRYRLLCSHAEIKELLEENERIHELYSMAEEAKLSPWIQGRAELDFYTIKVQYTTEKRNERFFTSVFETLKYLTQEFSEV